MKITTVLFDLDGTLLPQDLDFFIQTYFGALVKKLIPYGYDPQKFSEAMWAGIKAMITNNGEKSNEARFWDVFPSVLGEGVKEHYSVFEDFYINDFDRLVKPSCGYNPAVPSVVSEIKAMGLRTALATNPVFPSTATESRIKWAGLTPTDFEHYTTYENSSYAKPNLNYYREILDKLGVCAEECIMVGNDVGDDMVAQKLGMKTFLLTDNLINKSGEDISAYVNGGFDEMLSYIKSLI